MTFRGFEYQTIMDMQRCLLVAEADEKVLELELNVRRLQRDKEAVKEVQVKLNVQNQFIKNLKDVIEDTLTKIEELNDEMNDLDGKIFQDKFVYGLSNNEIMRKHYISETTMYRIFERINKHLNGDTGKKLKWTLS